MNIQSVKYSNKGYIVLLINGNRVFVPNDSQNFDYQQVQKWIANGGVVAEEFTVSELKTILSERIKGEASRRIQAVYPEWKQTNFMAAVAEIHDKEIVAMKQIPFIAQYQLTADELQIIKDANACKVAITAIRTRSNELEASLDNMTLAQLKVFDPTDNRNWS